MAEQEKEITVKLKWNLDETKVYFVNALVKVEFAVAKGKKLYDKREDLKKKDLMREKAKITKHDY